MKTNKTIRIMPALTATISDVTNVTFGGIEAREVVLTHEKGGSATFALSSQPSHGVHKMRLVDGRPPKHFVEHLTAWLAQDFPGIETV